MDERGTTFQGEAGIWRYQLSTISDGQALYDVTNPAQPVEIALQGGGFEAGPEAHRYLVTDPRTRHIPAVQRHQPIDLVTPREADAVPIAPTAFHAALAPLLMHRRAQGYAVELVDVAEINDTWSTRPFCTRLPGCADSSTGAARHPVGGRMGNALFRTPLEQRLRGRGELLQRFGTAALVFLRCLAVLQWGMPTLGIPASVLPTPSPSLLSGRHLDAGDAVACSTVDARKRAPNQHVAVRLHR